MLRLVSLGLLLTDPGDIFSVEPLSVLIAKLCAAISKWIAGHLPAAHPGLAAPTQNRLGLPAKVPRSHGTVRPPQELRYGPRGMSNLGQEQNRTRRDLGRAATENRRTAAAIQNAKRASRGVASPSGHQRAFRRATTQNSRTVNAIHDAKRANRTAAPRRTRPGPSTRAGGFGSR